jgi:hypothetical protein
MIYQNFKLSTLKYHSNIIAGILVFVTLFINFAESAYGKSLRNIYTSIFAYYLVSGLIISRFTLTKYSLIYILFLVLYVFLFYAFGSGNNLIIHLLTISFGVVLSYNSLLSLKYDVMKIWRFAKYTWYVIYLTLIIELIVVILGYQGFLYDVFPEANRTFGLPAYRVLNNTFANFFDLDFQGLNSITLQAQAYGQFCVMLSIFGFSYSKSTTYRKSSLIHLLLYIVLPLIFYSISPNIMSGIIFVFIIIYVLTIKLYLRIFSFTKFMALSAFFFALIFFYYFIELGFVRKYALEDLYDLFLGQQMDYMLTRSYSEYFLGVGLEEYYDVSPKFEIACLSYLSVSGLLFGLVNLIILSKFICSTLKQVKYQT